MQKSKRQDLNMCETAACFPYTGTRDEGDFTGSFPYKVLSVPTLKKKKGVGTETPAHHHLLLHVVLEDNL